MNNHITARRRALTLLAGFFGFMMTATLSVIPGSGVTDVIRAGTAAAANTASSRSTAIKAAKSRPAIVAGGWRQSYVQTLVSPAPKPVDGHGVADLAVLPRPGAGLGVDRRLVGLVREQAAALPTVDRAAVRVRGPPSITGS